MGADLVTLRDAARLSGKSVDTLRRWIRAGRLPAQRAGADHNAPVLVARGDVQALVIADASAPMHASGAVSAAGGHQPMQSGELAAVRAHLADVLAQRDGLRRERDEARAELAAVRVELGDTRRRLELVERELAGGVRGLLGAARRLVTGPR